jgi:hypothetical protein
MAASVETYVTERRADLTRLPDDLSEYELYDVYTYHLKPGHHGQFVEAYGKGFEAIVQETDDRYYVMLTMVNGAMEGDARVVVPHKRWADFETLDPSRAEIIQSVYGEETARQLYDQLFNAYRSSTNYVVRIRPELSVEGQR